MVAVVAAVRVGADTHMQIERRAVVVDPRFAILARQQISRQLLVAVEVVGKVAAAAVVVQQESM
jgi:hypothetical protein